MSRRPGQRLREREGGFASFITPAPYTAARPVLYLITKTRYFHHATKGGLLSLHRFDERSRSPDSVIALPGISDRNARNPHHGVLSIVVLGSITVMTST
jgi:hypothetical protein